MDEALLGLATSLTTLVYKDTVNAITTKIDTIKNERDINKLKGTYDEIVNQLISERGEAIRIAQSYREELERVTISDEDIEYLQQTISKVLEILKKFQVLDDNKSGNNSGMDAIKSIKGLISKDVLKTMQLLGFNYKEAIGQPLTNLCAEKISAIGNSKKSFTNKNKH